MYSVGYIGKMTAMARQTKEQILRNKVDVYCKSERQWLHKMRVKRAEAERDKAPATEKVFWNAVLDRLRPFPPNVRFDVK